MSTTLCGGLVAGVTLTGWHVEGGQQRAASRCGMRRGWFAKVAAAGQREC